MKPAREILKKVLGNTEYEAMLLSHVNDGVVGADAESRITFWGHGAERMYGFSAAEAVGKTTLEILRPVYEPGEREKIIEDIHQRGASVVTVRTKRKDGTEVIAEMNSTVLTDGRGRRTGYVVIYRDVTERHRTSQALREANVRLMAQAEEIQAKETALRGILDSAKESIWQFTPDGIVLMGNDTALKRFGRTAGEVVGRHFGEFVSPALAVSRQARLAEAAESRRPVEFEDVREGMAFHHSFYPVMDAAGNVSSIACFSRDITERRKVEEALNQARAEAEQRARELEIVMDAVPAGVMITRDPEGLHISGNRATHELLRIPLGEGNISKSAPDPERVRTYRPFRDGVEVPPDQLPVQMAARGHEVRNWGCDLVLNDGEVRHVIINASPLQREGEEFRGAVGAFLDVTDRIREEQARRRDRERYELLSVTAGRLLESENPQAVIDELCRRVMVHLDCQVFFNFLVDKAEGRLRLNACAGIPEAEIPRLKWLDYGTAVCGFVAQQGALIVAEDIPARPDPRTSLVAGFGVKAYACHPLMAGSEVLGTLSFGAKNRTRFSDEDLSLMRTVADQVSVAIERMRGRQALRERGLELQYLTETLEVKVQERTAELASANEHLRAEAAERLRLEEHLRHVQKLEALGTLAGGIAHDFNNILNPIFISTELLLLDAVLDPPSRHHLEVTLKAAERGRDLVKQIIAFSRQKEKDRKPLKAGPVVREAVNFLRVSLPSTVEIRADIGSEADFVLGDQAQIHQIVMNLCSNAAYAMRDKGGILTVSLAQVEVDGGLAAELPALRPGPHLRLIVADTGAGMTPEIRERAFDPFFTTKKPGEGSGMGLAVVDGIVRDYGGAITVQSEPGRGSTFVVYLPCVAVETAEDDKAQDALPLGSERILLVDDEEVQVRSVRSMLQRLGYEVVALTDSQKALARFRLDPRAFDLMITDQTMPQMTGMKLAEEVLRIRPDLPIILCTGFSEAVDAKEARALGIREFLMKPYSVPEMAQRIRQAVAGQHPPSA